MCIGTLKALRSSVSKKIKPAFPKYMYLSKQPTVTWLAVSLTFTSLLLLAVKCGVGSGHQWGRHMLAVSGSLAAGGSCVTRFWPVRINSRTLGISEERIFTAKRTNVAGWLTLSLFSQPCSHDSWIYSSLLANHDRTSTRVKWTKLRTVG